MHMRPSEAATDSSRVTHGNSATTLDPSMLFAVCDLIKAELLHLRSLECPCEGLPVTEQAHWPCIVHSSAGREIGADDVMAEIPVVVAMPRGKTLPCFQRSRCSFSATTAGCQWRCGPRARLLEDPRPVYHRKGRRPLRGFVCGHEGFVARVESACDVDRTVGRRLSACVGTRKER